MVRKEFDEAEQFVYNNKALSEDINKLDELLKTKYGIGADVDLSKHVSDKLHIIVEAGRELNICPCCEGAKMHTPFLRAIRRKKKLTHVKRAMALGG
ncbi:MAG TPA: hypothetical protein VF172_12480 [Nitrososphaera sp.]